MSAVDATTNLSTFLYDVLPVVGFFAGPNSPENVVAAGKGSLYLRTDGDANTTMYIKTTGTGATGWTAVASS
jgi:hypothetical protein